MVKVDQYAPVVVLALFVFVPVRATFAQIQNKTPAQDALKGMQWMIGTWSGGGGGYGGFEGAKRDANLHFVIRFRWLQRKAAVEMTSEVREKATGKRHNTGSKIMFLDAETRELRVVGYGYEGDVYFSNSGSMKIHPESVTLKINEMSVNGSKSSYTVKFARKGPEALSIQLIDVIVDAEKQKDWKIVLRSQESAESAAALECSQCQRPESGEGRLGKRLRSWLRERGPRSRRSGIRLLR